MQVSTGEVTQLGGTQLYTSFAPSPDARFLLVAWLERPYSYTVPCGRFPKRVQLWDRSVVLRLRLPHNALCDYTIYFALPQDSSQCGQAVIYIPCDGFCCAVAGHQMCN